MADDAAAERKRQEDLAKVRAEEKRRADAVAAEDLRARLKGLKKERGGT